jgi:putative colanic acid biosysnthesis UDP-glucose lipid carrier transferase
MTSARRQIRLKAWDGFSAPRPTERSVKDRKWPIHYASIEPMAIILDLITIFAASVFAGFLHHIQTSNVTVGDIVRCSGSAMLVSVLFISLMKIRGMYQPAELLALRSQVRAACTAWICVFLLLAGTVFALELQNEVSRRAGIIFAFTGLAALLMQRSLLRELLNKGLSERRFSGRSIVLITDSSQNSDISLIQTLTDLGFNIDEHFVFPRSNANDNQERLIEQIIDHTCGSNVEEIFVGADPTRWAELHSALGGLRVLPLRVNFIPTGTTSELLRRPSRELGNAICVELQRGPLNSVELFTKRCMDILLAMTALLIFSPLLAIVAIAIKLDSPGPVLFKQQRCGFNGRSFKIRKFRTMSVLEDGPRIIQAQSADKRVTRLGKWLRRTSIDELPQLFNVVEGSMSIVGPRPHALAHDNEFDKLVRNYAFRRRVKPGLTGLAQIKGCRGPTPTTASIEQRVEYDLWYIDNWSLTLDLTILLQTPLELLRGRNAY